MEGRDYTDLYRNTSEEWFLKSMMENSIGMAGDSPTMEILGFDNNNNNLSQSSRADSEELFNNWLTTSENNGGIAHRTRQASRRISAETSNVSNQQHDESSCEPNQPVTMNAVDMGLQASNLFLAKAWFNSSQPMTRSRSSELRRRFVHQNSYTSIGMEAMNNMNSIDANNFRQEHTDPNGFINASITEFPNHLTSFMSPSSNSSSCTFNCSFTPQAAGNNADNITSVVNMLKGTLERKKIYINDVPFGYYGSEEMLSASTGLNQVQENHTYNMQQLGNYQNVSYGIGVYGVAAAPNNFQRSTISREPSQSESSLGFDTCDGSSISGQTPSVSESSRKQMVNAKSSGNNPRATRVDQGDPTKKRRVERSRKMAEAKEKNMIPSANSDMQSLLKRCENLEKEVRSLKLNLAFMNRKDSEQTKQTDELQKQNEDLSKEKGRLLEEIERIISQTDHKM